jgi:hypothetical protein
MPQHRPALIVEKKKVLGRVTSGTGIERQSNTERLLPRRAFRSLQLLGNFRCWRLPFRHSLELANFARSPCSPLFRPLSHKTSRSNAGDLYPLREGKKSKKTVY